MCLPNTSVTSRWQKSTDITHPVGYVDVASISYQTDWSFHIYLDREDATMGELTRRAVFAVILGGPVLVISMFLALAGNGDGGNGGGGGGGAGSPVTLSAGEGTFVPTAPRRRYTKIKFTNLGPGTANIEISSSNYNNTFDISEGGVVTVTEIFGTRKTKIINKSTSATVRIESRWL